MDETRPLIVMGARTDDLANITTVFSLANVDHISVRIRLEDAIGDPQTAWETIAHTHLVNPSGVVLSNGPFWYHAKLLEPLMGWIAQQMIPLVLSCPHEVDPSDILEEFTYLRARYVMGRRVHILQAPAGIQPPIRQAERPHQVLLANGWQPIVGDGYA